MPSHHTHVKLQRFPDFEDHNGRITTTLGMEFTAPYFFENGIASVTCVASIHGQEFHKTEELRLDPAAAFQLYSTAGRLII